MPKHFYNISCREQIPVSCPKNGSQVNLTTFALRKKKSKCFRNVTFSENNFTTPRNNGSKCFKINVTWGRVKFSTKHDRVNGVWKNESWSFFLNSVVSQMCLNQSTYRRPPDMPSYVYPYYTDDRSNTAYLVEKHVYGGLCLL